MSHEQSETIRRPDGKWVNVYGRSVKGKAGRQIPGTGVFDTMEEAVNAARKRSRESGEGLIRQLRKPPPPGGVRG